MPKANYKIDVLKIISLKNVPKTNKCLGVLWCSCAILFLEMFLNDEPFAIESQLYYTYLIVMVPFYMIFQDRECISKTSEVFVIKKVLWLLPYILSGYYLFSRLYINEMFLGTDFGFPPMVRECTCIFFWIMSIPLTTIYNCKIWGLYAFVIMLNSILYYHFLAKANEVVTFSQSFITTNIIFIIICCIISLALTRYYYRQL